MTTDRAAVLTWDYREQPDMDRLGRLLRELSGGGVHLHRVDTGSDQYAIIVATAPLDDATVQDAFHQWWIDDDAPEIFEIIQNKAPTHGGGSLPHGYVDGACGDYCNNLQCPAGQTHDRCTEACIQAAKGEQR